MKISSNVVCDFNNENEFPHKLLLTNTQVSKLYKAFANGLSANVKLLNNQLHIIKKSQAFSGRLLGPLLKPGLPWIGNVLKPLAKSALIPLGLTTIASAAEAATHKNMFWSDATTLIISIEEMHDIMKIVKSLEESGLLIKYVRWTIKNEAKEQKGELLGTLLVGFGSNLLGN